MLPKALHTLTSYLLLRHYTPKKFSASKTRVIVYKRFVAFYIYLYYLKAIAYDLPAKKFLRPCSAREAEIRAALSSIEFLIQRGNLS